MIAILFAGLHWESIGVFMATLIFYYGFNTILQYIYYTRDPKTANEWKIQSKKVAHLGERQWWLPYLQLKGDRPENYAFYTTVNVLIAATFACFTAEYILRGKSYLYWFDDTGKHDMTHAVFSSFRAIFYECVVEYYWHRLMHLPYFYKRFHKIHHAFKNPEPFDDMYVHPLEVTGYYCILWSPPFLFEMHYYAFLTYAIIMAVTGVLDHSGVKVHLPGIYSSEDHDLHHSKFEVNYAFPLNFMDILHGTYRGTYLGMKWDYQPKRRAS